MPRAARLRRPGRGEGRHAVTDYRNWLIAARVPRVGSARLFDLSEELGGIDAVVSAPVARLRRAGLDDEAIAALRRPDEALLESDLAWLAEPDHHLLPRDDPRYPPLLCSVPSPPPMLFVAGDPDSLWQPQLAVIGSRNPTAGGRDNARDFAAALARQGLTVTSGMAAGIDSEAHRAALDAGGRTVAVLGTGPDVVYPPGAESLASRIAGGGALVSELPPGTPAKKEHFPSRNRIISGLSLGVLVIEAGLRSGTLITARLAGVQGRDVFALPGSIHNPMAKGCHRLIRDGARLVESVEEILQEVAPLAARLADQLRDELEAEPGGPPLDSTPAGPQLPDDPDYRALWSCLGFDPKPVDSIIEQCGLTARAVSAMLLMLELRGMVEAHPRGAYSRTTRGQ